MKTFIVNAARGVVSKKKKYDVKSKLLGREWRMLTDEPAITGKYIFLKDGKLLLSINGISTYSTWQMATESSVIMDEGVTTFLYQIIHIDNSLIVLNLDGTDNFCFLINEASTSLAKASFKDIQWYLYRNCNIDMLTPEQKKDVNQNFININNRNPLPEEKEGDAIPLIIVIIMMTMGLLIIIGLLLASSKW